MTWSDFKAEIESFLPVDAEREGARDFIDKLMRAGCIDLQGHIPRLRPRTPTVIGYADVTLVGCSSLGVVPSSGSIIINELWRVRAPVAGNFEVGHNYRITSIGSTDFTLVGAASNTVGLFFTATGVGTGTGTAEEARFPIGQAPWSQRYQLINAMDMSDAFALDPDGLQFYVSPNLGTSDKIEIVWTGIKLTFLGVDVLPDNWDSELAECVSFYVKQFNSRTSEHDAQLSATYQKDFLTKRRTIFAREKERQLVNNP